MVAGGEIGNSRSTRRSVGGAAGATLVAMRGARRAPRHVVVVGLMGAGKSTVGRRLAELLDRSWRDSDRDIEAATGLTVRALGDRDGIEAMHALEARHLLDALAEAEPSVISAAASSIDNPDCRSALAGPDVAVVWLRATTAVLAERFGSDEHRPWYGASPAVFLAEQAARREPLLVTLDSIVIDVDEIHPDEAAARAVTALR